MLLRTPSTEEGREVEKEGGLEGGGRRRKEEEAEEEGSCENSGLPSHGYEDRCAAGEPG